ncbi:hypothetical protein [Azospirillum ramasamyi]|uniref:Uncharacterized protein n=1 Tax=Azospirillum ramasamyi TaxID=682998 RepID=A0A2U9SEM5_9PROT|nr:hypothetical protein [Azospirillum ramasamyi]AWU98070.1 hypothetical protein DM194_27670 [Azospirillum ramasamyi]
MPRKLTTSEFIEKARSVHGRQYDYSRVDYVNSATDIIIVCPQHGEFRQKPANHLAGYDCYACGRDKVSAARAAFAAETGRQFEAKARAVHGDRYDYSGVVYAGCQDNVVIRCNEHGDFHQTPNMHLRGDGCRRCGRRKTQKVNEAKSKRAAASFVNKARLVHGDKYDYSQAVYRRSTEHVLIGCPRHGAFNQTPNMHLHGNGCPRCGQERRDAFQTATAEKAGREFADKARCVHGDRYDYSLVSYTDNTTKVTIVCREHGPFIQSPNPHLMGRGCPDCGDLQRAQHLAEESAAFNASFTGRAREIHGDRYDYSKAVLRGALAKITIVCPKHGPFSQAPTHHLAGQGCRKCGHERVGAARNRAFAQTFIERAKLMHGDRFDYSETEYVDSRTPILVICNVHGATVQLPGEHLRINGYGCRECGMEIHAARARQRAAEAGRTFVERAKAVHGDRYDYRLVEYITSGEKITIICGKHGAFDQAANSHLNGRGCPSCMSSRGEQTIAQWLDEHDMDYVPQANLFGQFRYDFHVPDRNLLIEFDGIQHFIPQNFGGQGPDAAERYFQMVKRNDAAKTDWAQAHGFVLERIAYYEDIVDRLEEIFVQAKGLVVPVGRPKQLDFSF